MLFKFLDPKNDVAFKKIFGSEKNKDILIHFLNDILGFVGSQAIQSVEFLSPLQDPDIAAKKQSIVDVLCRDEKGVKFIVEMQVAKSKGFEKRAQYYAAKAYAQQADKGEEYYDLREIIFIAIADCVLFPNKADYKSDHVILDKENYDHDLKDFSFTFIELPKFRKKEIAELETLLEKWCYFFKYAAETQAADLEQLIGGDQIIKRAYEALDQFYWSENELALYEQERKRVRDEAAVLAQKIDDATEKGLQKGLQKGREEGREEGRKEGHKEGREEGRKEGREEGREEEKWTVVSELLKTDLTLEQIAKATRLSLEEVRDRMKQ
jgi:predicted transposase/invertase (TIGR01784 family)